MRASHLSYVIRLRTHINITPLYFPILLLASRTSPQMLTVYCDDLACIIYFITIKIILGVNLLKTVFLCDLRGGPGGSSIRVNSTKYNV